jgi:dihydrofolate reductase
LIKAVDCFNNEDEVFIIGGASVYIQALEFVEKLYVTRVHQTFKNAQTFFYEIDENEWIKTESEEHQADDRHAYDYTFETYIKKK